MKISNLKDMVENALMLKPKARVDDNLLICIIYNKLGLNIKMPFIYLMEAANKGNYPTFESITRARRKVLEEHPEWRDEKVDLARKQKQEEYIEFARGNR